MVLLSKSLKQTFNEKKTAFQSKDQLERKRIQSELRKVARNAKKRYKEKVEFQIQRK